MSELGPHTSRERHMLTTRLFTARPTYGYNSASTDIYLTTDTSTTAFAYSATGTIQPAASSVPFYNVSSVASSASTAVTTASSNFTLPSATATATIPAGFVVQSSVPYAMQALDVVNLPTIYFDLLNETEASRTIICNQQTQFCATAGCADVGAKVNENFCNPDTMGVRCSCDKGSSNLKQWQWPVQMSDCLLRGSACNTACMIPGGSTEQRTACKAACSSQFSSTCGFPGQYSANYAVSKKSEKPGLTMVQGGSAGDGALSLKAVTGVMSIVVACFIAFVLV